MRGFPVFALALAVLMPAGAAEEYQVFTEHPRLILRPGRLRLLKRERERRSPRWQQFESLLAGKAPMPEPALANALFYRVAGDRDAGTRAVAWALGPGARDLRQLALVFDWCQDVLDGAQSGALALKLRNGIEQTAADERLPAVNARVLAAVALAGHAPDPSAGVLERVVNGWWEGRIVPQLKGGRDPLPSADYYALFEMLHALRDNLNLDLRLSTAAYFKEIAFRHLLAYYPASYPAGENDYRIPAAPGTGEPDLRRAALARAADLAMVSYDLNSPGGQAMQGWLMHDRFQLRGPFGAPYEFLWANPYQPGLSYYHAPLIFHDERYGRLYVRSSWEEDAAWLGTVDGEVQTFKKGTRAIVDPKSARAPFSLTEATVVFANAGLRFNLRLAASPHVFVLGLKPRQAYQLEVDDQEMREATSDPGGILRLALPPEAETGFRLCENPYAKERLKR
ncbi:MAG TPA: hypothetical protein VN442_16425 [Bryobacteraceae bacterium]|nr:hypothetical protein [Bryobacteraceae bacterium]